MDCGPCQAVPLQSSKQMTILKPMQINTTAARARIVAVLGPTNTGKTHLALERMLGHATGMIGFPLRLLARENYDRAVKLKGRAQVALITGEEKIVPPGARYFFCTVESMPMERPVAFIGLDEIQMCADPDRGHIFTHRLLHARGSEETMFMGAETIKPLLRRLAPEHADARLDLMMDYAQQAGPDEVPDPYYGSQRDFAYMCRLLDGATENLLRSLETRLSGPV